MLVLLVRGGFNRLEIPFSGSVVPKTWSWPISTFLSGASWLISNFTVCVVAFDFVERERKGIRRLGWCDPTKAQIWSRTMRLFNWWWNQTFSHHFMSSLGMESVSAQVGLGGWKWWCRYRDTLAVLHWHYRKAFIPYLAYYPSKARQSWSLISRQ